MQKPLVILTGPTAVGKTELSINLAKAINGEIISADSMQVYKYMDIGTAKITIKEMCGVPHHLIDILDPKEEFNVALFKELAKEAITKIYDAGKIPIVVGGTGFYIQALVKDIDFTETNKSDYRTELEKIANHDNGAQILHDMLKEIDYDSYLKVHQNNVKRVIRALEFYKETNTKISEHNEKEFDKSSPYNYAYFVLNNERDILYNRINKRVDIMANNGLVEEVQKLLDMGLDRSMVSMQGLGYKEIIDFLDGRTTLEEAIDILKRDTRHFAKRQLTWFRREKDVIWLDKHILTDEKMLLETILNDLKNKQII